MAAGRQQIQATTITSSTAETTIATASSGKRLNLRTLIVSNKSATAVQVTIKDATSGTTRLILQVPAGDVRGIDLNVPMQQAVSGNNWTATTQSVDSIYITTICDVED